MEPILQYVSVIALCGTAVSFVVGLVKWIDQRNREQEQRQHEAFHRMICIASGVNETGESVSMLQQLAAIYQLRSYRRYAFASVPLLEHMKIEIGKSNDERLQQLLSAIDETIAELSKS